MLWLFEVDADKGTPGKAVSMHVLRLLLAWFLDISTGVPDERGSLDVIHGLGYPTKG